jgi:hypothetical protein
MCIPMEPTQPVPIQDLSFRAVPCTVNSVSMQETFHAEGDDWSHMKVQILGFTAVETDASGGKPRDERVEVCNPGSSMIEASITVRGAGVEILPLRPTARLDALVAQAVFKRGLTDFPVQAVLSGSYTSPRDGVRRQLKDTTFVIQHPGASVGCCVIA